MDITPAMIAATEQLIGLEFTASERELMLTELGHQRDAYEQLRDIHLDNNVPPALTFDPRFYAIPRTGIRPAPNPSASTTAPQWSGDIEQLAFAPISYLAELIRSRQISSVALTEMYLRRLKHYDPLLHCVITLTEDLALSQAQRADSELANGQYRGPLHGIPWAVKDLLATKNIRTTWGATPYKNQMIDLDATVVQRLEVAGAVLLAKLAVGELAWGDVWFDAMCRNPWNPAEGSSGSSAGAGAVTAAGLAGFTIGTETLGSIISPSTRCGVTGLRPTFGRVSRAGAMSLCWSMDKIGPMCRSVEDCALVFAAIRGPDGIDTTVVDLPFEWNPHIDLHQLRIGYLKSDFEQDYESRDHDLQTLAILRALGVELIPISLPDYHISAMRCILDVESAAAFDELTRSNRDDLLVRQIEEAWPNRFRQARLIPAVEYIQANRVRTLVMRAMADLMTNIDVYLAPSLVGDNLTLSNLTGYPALVLPNGFTPAGTPTSITFTGRLYDEATLLAVAKAYQDATDFHLRYPPLPE